MFRLDIDPHRWTVAGDRGRLGPSVPGHVKPALVRYQEAATTQDRRMVEDTV